MDGSQDRRLLDECRLLLSHEMRSPLMVMAGFTQQLLDQYGESVGDKGRYYLSRMLGASQRLAAQVEGMLALMDAAQQPMAQGAVDLTALCTRAAAAAAAAHPGRPVEVDIAAGMACEGDARLIGLAIGQLVDNAWKFTGKVDRAQVRMGVEPGGVFFVADNGAGFEADYSAKLFQLFGKLHPVHEFPGQGFGLALVRHVVERHGGRAWADGRTGEGSTFRLTLGPQADLRTEMP